MPLKLAFLGAWHSHAPMHIREAAQRPDEFHLTGLYDPDNAVVERMSQQGAKAGLKFEIFPSTTALLDSDIDAVIVEGHVYQNLDYATQALEAGKHVLLEKPAGVDIAQLETLHALSQAVNLQLHMAYMWRYNPALATILRLAQAGALGDIFFFRGHIPKPKAWHPQLAEEFTVYHGGVYFEMAGHLIDLMVALLGEPHTVLPALGKHYGDCSEVDNAVVVHQCERGLGTVDTGAMYIGMARRIEVHGTAGSAIHAPIGSANLSLCLESEFENYRTGDWQDLTLEEAADAPSLLRELAACIRGDKAPNFSLTHDMAVQRTLFAGCQIADGKALK